MDHLALRPRLGSSLFFAGIVALGTACGELKTATPGDGSLDGGGGSSNRSGSGSSDAPTTGSKSGGATSGPGMHGSLPSGYCCNDDSECRDGHCAVVAGVADSAKICQDFCREQRTCVRRNLSFKCNAPTTHDDGWCEPETTPFTCLPQASFQRGTRQVGECCVWTPDGNSGEECDGNKCISTGNNVEDGPFVCSQHCRSTSNCPSSTICGPWGTCDPANFPYACK